MARVHLRNAKAMNDSKSFEEALVHVNKSLEFYPLQNGMRLKGSCLLLLGRFTEALEAFSECISMKPGLTIFFICLILTDDCRSFNSRGTVYCVLEQYENALKDYETAIKLKPDDLAYLTNRASVLRDLKRTKEAIESFQYILSSILKNKEIFIVKGIIIM